MTNSRKLKKAFKEYYKERKEKAERDWTTTFQTYVCDSERFSAFSERYFYGLTIVEIQNIIKNHYPEKLL